MVDIIATERIYDPEQAEQGLSVVLFHPGDVVPEATAKKLGLTSAATKKVTADKVENKAVTPDAK